MSSFYYLPYRHHLQNLYIRVPAHLERATHIYFDYIAFLLFFQEFFHRKALILQEIFSKRDCLIISVFQR